MKTVPAISVMMCAYNAEQYLREAIESVLQQTFKDFEFVIVDDGSTDNTVAIVQSYKDRRIRLVRGEHDYIRSLNLGMRNCRADLVARMDADDKMMPQRLERQLAVMQDSPDLAVCFSWAEKFGAAEGIHGFGVRERVDNAFFWLLTGNYLTHPTAMLRKSFLKSHRLYYKRYPYAEDYKLWTDITRLGGPIHVIPEPLIQYRVGYSQISYRHNVEQNETKLLIQQEIIEELLHRMEHPSKKSLSRLYQQTLLLNQDGTIQGNEIVVLMFKLFQRIFFNYKDIREF
ncbi:MAG: glycosyltransferase [Bacteroidaceae bacterium]|nr:glycosyltransferase [Bacteroidaceae bacterium]